MKRLFLLFIFLACFAVNISAQNSEKQFELKGVVKDKSSGVIAGLPLFFKSSSFDTFVSTNLNGYFSISLPAGNYEVTVRKNISENFRAFITISDNRLNPNFLELDIETNQVCCGESSEKPYPKIIKSETPKYPAAAMAVRAVGGVSVKVKINKQGEPISADAVSGHPLLRIASQKAALNFRFEPIEPDEQEMILTFVYIPFDVKENVERYVNPYRIIVVGENVTINISET